MTGSAISSFGPIPVTGTPAAGYVPIATSSTAAAWASEPGKIIGLTAYNPGSQATLTTSSTSYSDADSTNLSLTFTAPSTGKVLVKLTAYASVQSGDYEGWNLRSGGSDVSGTASLVLRAVGATQEQLTTYDIYLSGLTPGSSYTYKWGFKCLASTAVYILAGGTSFGAATMVAFVAP